MHNHAARPNARTIADQDIAQHLGARTHYDMIAHRRMAFATFFTGAAQGHALIQQHIVANLGGLTDHHSHTMVDEKPASDLSARMDLDAGDPSPKLRNEPGQQRDSQTVKPVGEPVQENRVQARVAQ